MRVSTARRISANLRKSSSLPTVQALRAAKLASAAYEPWEKCKEICEAQGFNRFEYFDDGNVQAFVAANSLEMVYCFAGTNEIADWATNLDLHKRLFIDVRNLFLRMKVHSGFLKATESIREQMYFLMVDWFRPGMKLTGVGHSYGAAICTLFTYKLALGNPEVFLFGCPRVGNKAFAKEYNLRHGNKTWRIVNANDCVSRVPPWRWGFRHIGRVAYLDWRGRLRSEPSFLRRGWNQIVGRIHKLWTLRILFSGVSDHGMGAYIRKLSKFL
jgi:triacylglycerol lipase